MSGAFDDLFVERNDDDVERDCRRRIAEIYERYRREYERDIAPYVRILSDIEMCGPPPPIIISRSDTALERSTSEQPNANETKPVGTENAGFPRK